MTGVITDHHTQFINHTNSTEMDEGSIHSGRTRNVFSQRGRNSLHSGRTRWVIVLQYERVAISRDAQQFKAWHITQWHRSKHGMASVKHHGISTSEKLYKHGMAQNHTNYPA